MKARTKKQLQAERQRIRERMALVEHGGPAYKAYLECLEVIKRKLARLRKRLFVESPDAE